ncbi:hypothetical protein [Azorhizobium sp. AG788]|uniref:hypothetical protein n=1 Tax=Azorhizobium sp. AG788 TaxID=2183897 RepID=UPI003139468A
MAKARANWCWADARPAKPSDDNRLTVRLHAKTYGQLQAMARLDGISIHKLAASLLQAVAEDDAAAHAGGA